MKTFLFFKFQIFKKQKKLITMMIGKKRRHVTCTDYKFTSKISPVFIRTYSTTLYIVRMYLIYIYLAHRREGNISRHVCFNNRISTTLL